MTMQDEVWAQTKRSGNPVGFACVACASALRRGWPSMSWPEAVLKKQIDTSFATEVMQARAFVKRGGSLPPFIPQSYDTEQHLGYLFEQTYGWLTTERFEAQFGKKASAIPEVSQLLQTLRGINGEPTTGLLVKLPDHDAPIVKFFSWTGAVLSNKLLQPEHQVRPMQAEMVASTAQQANSLEAGAATLTCKRHPCIADLQGWVDKANAAAVPEQPAPVRPPEVPQPAREVDEVISSVGGVDLLEALRPPSSATQKGRGRGRGRGASAGVLPSPKRKVKGVRSLGPGRGSPKAKVFPKAPRPPAPATTAVKKEEEESDTSERSRSRSRGQAPSRAAASSRESALAAAGSGELAEKIKKAREYIDDTLSLSRVLLGAPKLKSALYNANRLLTSLESIETSAVEALELRAHLDLVELAKQVAVGLLPNIDRATRKGIFEKLCPHVRDFPAVWQIQWLAVYVRECPLDSAESINTWLQAVSPLCGPDEGAASCRMSGYCGMGLIGFRTSLQRRVAKANLEQW